MRSAADIEEVGWPEPAAVLQRMESTRSCWPSWRANSRSVVAIVSVTAMSLLGTNGAKVPLRGVCVDLDVKFIECPFAAGPTTPRIGGTIRGRLRALRRFVR